MRRLKSLRENDILIKDMQEKSQKEKKSLIEWIKALGFVGFMFFLIKGLVWLAILMLPAYFAC